MKRFFTKLTFAMAFLLMGSSYAMADLTPTVVVNEDFSNGATLFTGASRITVANDNNAKFTTASNSTNGYSNATYNFSTEGASAVRVQFSYWIANAGCNYDVAFVIRDKDVDAGHARNSMGLNGAFFSVGRSRQSSANYFSVNQGKTAAASDNNLGLWCAADIYIDLAKKTVDYTIKNQETEAVIKSETGKAFLSANAKSVSQIDFFACVNSETDYLDNLVITKYVDNSVTYYTASFTEQNGLTPNVTIYSDEARTKSVASNMLTDGTYYFTATADGYDDYNGSFTVSGSNPSVSFTMTQKSLFTFTVNAVDENNNVIKALLVDEEAFDGKANLTAKASKYITDENGKVQYVKNDETYLYTYTASATNPTQKVSYKKYEGTAYFVEVEKAVSATSVEAANYSGYTATRGIASAKKVFTMPESGKYDMTYAICNNNVNYDVEAYFYKNSEDNIIAESGNIKTVSVNYIKTTGTKTQEGIVLQENDNLMVKGSTTNLIFDYILLVKTGEATVTVSGSTITPYVTFSSKYALDFTDVEGIKAYVATGYTDEYVTVEEVTGAVPANTGLLIKGAGSAEVPVAASATAPENNLLVAVAEETVVSKAEDGTNYVLAYNATVDGYFGFYYINNTPATVGAGTAYLHTPTALGAKLRIFMNDDATAITNVKTSKSDNIVYNLAGQRVNAQAKGIVIINGKKVMVK